MEIGRLLSEEFILLNPESGDKPSMLKELCSFAEKKDIITDSVKYLEVLNNREKLGSTGIGKNIAIPHGRSEFVNRLSIILARHKEGIEFDSLDGTKAKLIFLLAAPLDVESRYLKVLANLSMLLRDRDFREKIIAADDEKKVMDIIREND
ncbi:MAG: PTS sugar transporter subunit IIA [Candidatus Muiribacteriaceae bacterium]